MSKGWLMLILFIVAEALLAADITSALTFFCALKLATRLKHDEPGGDHNKFNDYYLIGNLASVTMAIFYVYLYKHFDSLPVLVNLTH